MAISEMKMQMVIDNYFKDECDTNTSIRQAFEKGFRIGVKKGVSMNRPQEWIPCSERLPEPLEEVMITWVNNSPPSYYSHMKGVPQTDEAVYFRGDWYWWDSTIVDVLGEYGKMRRRVCMPSGTGGNTDGCHRNGG